MTMAQIDHWLLPAACIAVILGSILYHAHDGQSSMQLLQDLASMQITGVLLVSAVAAAARGRAHKARPTSVMTPIHQHPMLPQAAARKRQQMPLV